MGNSDEQPRIVQVGGLVKKGLFRPFATQTKPEASNFALLQSLNRMGDQVKRTFDGCTRLLEKLGQEPTTEEDRRLIREIFLPQLRSAIEAVDAMQTKVHKLMTLPKVEP